MEDKKMALLEFLQEEYEDIKITDIKNEGSDYSFYGSSYFITPYGEYAVYTDSEADIAHQNDLENLIDDIGLLGIWKPGSWQYDYVISHFISADNLWENIEEYYIDYFEDIKSEDGITFETRQMDEVIEILDKEGKLPVNYDDLVDFVNNKNHNEECENFLLNYDKEVDEYIEICAKYCMDDYDSPIDYYVQNFGDEEVNYLIEKGLVNIDIVGISNWVIDCDGRGNSLASYDGEENEIEYNDEYYYIYRCN